jgi:BirA family transcriptional regulator, biotin operon repressor / biotin---[acetyl-CoA-carboxylase] ligase
VNVALLQRLKADSGGFVPRETLAEVSGEVAADLQQLARFGYVFEEHPYLGIAYRGPAERLCPDVIEWQLEIERIGRRIAVWDRVTSTNDLAARAGHSLANEGLVVLAEEQTAGRGRRGRAWTAPRESSILMSVLLFPEPAIDDPSWLTALGAVATAEVVEEITQRPTRIKWPNDVRVGGRKIAGVLVERGTGSILGIGLNVNMFAVDFPDPARDLAISLRILCGERLDRSEIARQLVRRLDQLYELGRSRGPDSLTPLWRDRLEALGQTVCLQTTSGSAITGRLVDAGLSRGLVLECGEGRPRTISNNEVHALRHEPSNAWC